MSEPASIRPAACVILCRQPLDPQVYWVRRRDDLPFLGGFHAFPGGALSPEDDPAAWGLRGAPADAGSRLGALRELHEETGILLGRPGAGAGPAAGPAGPFRAALRSAGLLPDIESLVPAGRWIGAPISRTRFDTAFYLAWAPEGCEPRPAPEELAAGKWIRPEAALDAWSEGRALLAPPTLYALRGLCAAAIMIEGEQRPLELADAAEQLTGAPEAAGGPVTRIEMRPGFFLYPMATRTLPGATHTNAFLVGSGEMVLIDPGSDDPQETARLAAFIDQLGTEGRRVAEIWLTHHHPDHVGGAAPLARALNVPVRAHPETAARLAGGPVAVEGTLHDGTVRAMAGLPGWRLRVIHTPGHAPGHLAILEEKSGSLIAGDMVTPARGVLIDPPEGDVAAYLASLRRLLDVGAAAIFPSHGAPTTGVRGLLEGCLAHRLERESRVLAALAGGALRAPEEMLPEVYADVDASLHRLAARNLLAHLLKLAAEGRVRVEGERYRAI